MKNDKMSAVDKYKSIERNLKILHSISARITALEELIVQQKAEIHNKDENSSVEAELIKTTDAILESLESIESKILSLEKNLSGFSIK